MTMTMNTWPNFVGRHVAAVCPFVRLSHHCLLWKCSVTHDVFAIYNFRRSTLSKLAVMAVSQTGNTWQSLAYSPLGVAPICFHLFIAKAYNLHVRNSICKWVNWRSINQSKNWLVELRFLVLSGRLSYLLWAGCTLIFVFIHINGSMKWKKKEEGKQQLN